MKVSYNWLKDYFSIDVPADQVVPILTNTGLEVERVEDYESVPGGLEGLLVGHVTRVYDHPNADKLKLTEVDIGKKQLKIVCGAPNIAESQKVVVAPVGSTIHPVGSDPVRIKKAKIRGEKSEGMICAEDEIGLGSSHEGVMVLPESAKIGTPVSEYFDVYQDTVFDIDLTPNRMDALSHIGVARDLKAYFTIHEKNTPKLHWPDVNNFGVDNQDHPIEVEVKDKKACPRYAGVTITGLKIEPSPQWLQNKLKAIDIGPVNNVVDVTNFVLWELGQPLHAFDVDKITGNKLIVQKLSGGTTFKTLEEKQVELSEDDLMICNAEEGMCIGGVMGGIDSGIKEQTTGIFLESAYFDPTHIRRTSERHDLKTDAANRFEKGADPDMVIFALKRAALLIKELAGGKISSEVVDVYPEPIQPTSITLDLDYLNTIAGQKIPQKKVKTILDALDIEVEKTKKKKLKLKVPPYRADVNRPADVIEEILRIYGYNNIVPAERMSFQLPEQDESHTDFVRDKVSDYLVSNGFYEMMNNSLVNSAYLNQYKIAEKNSVPMLNYSSAELDVLRPTMLFSGLEMLRYNRNRKIKDIRAFEFGHIYHKEDGKYAESQRLALFLTGNQWPDRWNAPHKSANFYQLKGFVKNVLQLLGVETYTTSEIENKDFDYGLTYSVNGRIIGYTGQISAQIGQDFDLDQPIFYADLDLDTLLKLHHETSISYEPVPKYPVVERDLALLLDHSVTFGQIVQLAYQQEDKILQDVQLFDVYEGEKIEAGKKSYAVRFTFQDKEKTLTDDQVDQKMNKLIKVFNKKINAEIR